MSHETKIEPALTAEEWRTPMAPRTDLFACIEDRALVLADGTPNPRTGLCVEESTSLHALIALANAALPDDDPRKITRTWIEHIRFYGNQIPEPCSWGDERDEEAKRVLDAIADALLSYLPPQTG